MIPDTDALWEDPLCPLRFISMVYENKEGWTIQHAHPAVKTGQENIPVRSIQLVPHHLLQRVQLLLHSNIPQSSETEDREDS